MNVYNVGTIEYLLKDLNFQSIGTMVKNRSKIDNPSCGSTLIGPVGKLTVGS